MKKHKIIGGLLLILLAVFACQEQSELIEELDLDREFSPLNIELEAVNHNSATVTWKAIKGSTENFVVQIFQNDSLAFEGTPVEEHKVDFAYKLKFENLFAEVRYSVRMKTVGETTDRDSKWHSMTFKTSSEQILTGINDIRATRALVKWMPGEVATHLLLTSTGLENVTINLENTDLTSGEKMITGLLPNKTYSVSIYNGIGRRGKLTLKTMYKPEDATLVPMGANLTDYLTEGATLLLADGYAWTGPADAIVNLPSNIRIYGDPDAYTTPKLIGAFPGGGKCFFNLPETGGDIIMANVEITQLEGLGGFSIIDQQFACTIATLKLDNCYIHDIERSLVRLRDKACIVSSLLINNCVIENVGYSASNNQTFYFQAGGGYVSEFKLTNSTFDSCGWKTQFIDNRPSADQNSSVIVENCTFYNVIAGDSNSAVRYFLIATKSGSSVVSLKMSNTILGKTFDAITANLQGDANTAVTIDQASVNNFKTNDWRTATSLNNAATIALEFAGVASTGGNSNDLFVNPQTHDFTLKSTAPAIVKLAGDPRWR